MFQFNCFKGTKRKLAISNPEKILYQAAKFRKIDVVEYYTRVAPYLLPHIRNQPAGEAFYETGAPSLRRIM